MSIWLSGKSYLVTECTNEVPLIAVFTDYCPDLLPNVLAGSPLLQQTKGKSHVQSFLSYFCLQHAALTTLTFSLGTALFSRGFSLPQHVPWPVDVLFISYSI